MFKRNSNIDLIIQSEKDVAGSASWESPSNIALVKYWGKHGIQLPNNPSLSFSLNNTLTRTSVEYTSEKSVSGISLEFYFERKRNPEFEERIIRYFQLLSVDMPFLSQLHFVINSKNTFPHSSGIASSASAFSALALCLCSIENQLFGTLQYKDQFFNKASFLARLGSGSACRSVYPGLVVWGETSSLKGSSDEFAVTMEEDEIHPLFNNLHDSILIVSSKSKSVKSSAGHSLMNDHPFADNRYDQAGKNLTAIIKALQTGDFERFANITETEALSLHAMMMTSSPSYLLLKPESLRIIEKVRKLRSEKSIPFCFTIDAGPNIHLIYPGDNKNEIRDFIESELLLYCEQNYWIDDYMGPGPLEIEKDATQA